MKSSTKGGIVVAIAVAGVLAASVIATRLLNRPGQADTMVTPPIDRAALKSSSRRKTPGTNPVASPPPVVKGPPYYVRLTLENSFTQELHFSSDGTQRVGYLKDGTQWLIEVEARRRSANTIQIQMNADRFREKGTLEERGSSMGFGSVLTLDAPPFVSPDYYKEISRKNHGIYDNIELKTFSVSVSSKPTIATKSPHLTMR